MQGRDKMYLKRLNIILFALMLSLTGCKNDASKSTVDIDFSSEEINSDDHLSYFDFSIDKVIFLNDYAEYKDYLKNPAPTYELLYKTVKNNSNIPSKYKEVLNQIINLFEINEISNEHLGVFYENLYRLIFNTNYELNDSNVAAYFQSHSDTPSINIDENSVDFYTILHEIIHSCHETMIKSDDKIIVITSKITEKTLITDEIYAVKYYGKCFTEGQAEYIAQYLCNSQKRLFLSADSYNTTNNILEFWIDTLGIDINTFFSYNLNDFIASLTALGISEMDIKNIINDLDAILENKEATFEDSYQARYSFYQKYVPKLVEYYIREGLSSKDIYKVIGKSLKTSVIERVHDESDIIYRGKYLNNQKKLFDNIDGWLKEILNNHQMETSSIYYYIGHEFEIYYSLYGKEFGLSSNDYYLGYNWDEAAINNCQILLYTEDQRIKMCSYAENQDGTLCCYDYDGEIANINNGIKLCDLLSLDVIDVESGYLKYNYSLKEIVNLINNHQITIHFDKESLTNAKDRYLYLDNGNAIICNLTTNEEGEDIPYQVFSNQIYLIPENAIKIGNVNELIRNKAITVNKKGNILINVDKLNQFLKESNDKFSKSFIH